MRILQVAPSERSLTRRFHQIGDLVLGDLHPDRYPGIGARKVDLLNFGDLGTFDLIYASHVLEHVPDDLEALKNMAAHLADGGHIWLLVPLKAGPTQHGTPTMSAKQRERLFGQWDHLRQYGEDFGERIATGGFRVTTITRRELGNTDWERFGLADDVVYVGHKG
jgi:SAM-dependent methyltransferase